MFFKNGQLLTYGDDYTISGTTLTFTSNTPAPTSTDILKLLSDKGDDIETLKKIQASIPNLILRIGAVKRQHTDIWVLVKTRDTNCKCALQSVEKASKLIQQYIEHLEQNSLKEETILITLFLICLGLIFTNFIDEGITKILLSLIPHFCK